MKALVRDYLASLRERDELDAVLPELLGELGFHVFSRPGRGTHQLGVDVAATGMGDDGEQTVFLFSVKPGNLTRQDWMNDTPQALKYSLEEIIGVYLRNRLPAEYKTLKVVVCLVIGGEIHEHMREHLRAFYEANESARITFQEWDGDRLAELILKGFLREEILPAELRSSFRKAIAMLDEPEVSMEHFSQLTRSLLTKDVTSKARLRVARQVNICTWILFVWARGIGNLEAPYRASELALLSTWELVRRSLGAGSKSDKKLLVVLTHTVNLHLSVSRALLAKIMPFAGVLHGVSSAVESSSPLDVNLALFQTLGRIGIWGLWMNWLRLYQPEGADAFQKEFEKAVSAGLQLIRSNPTLLLPVADEQATDIALFLLLSVRQPMDLSVIRRWLREMAGRLVYAVKVRQHYPSCATEYADLDDQEANFGDEEFFRDATAGSTLVPLIAAWLYALDEDESYNSLTKLVQSDLEHCTLQLWIPDASSESALYVNDAAHGRAITGLYLGNGGQVLVAMVTEVCNRNDDFQKLSPMVHGFWPIVLVACHYHRLPIPPNFWIEALAGPETAVDSGSGQPIPASNGPQTADKLNASGRTSVVRKKLAAKKQPVPEKRAVAIGISAAKEVAVGQKDVARKRAVRAKKQRPGEKLTSEQDFPKRGTTVDKSPTTKKATVAKQARPASARRSRRPAD